MRAKEFITESMSFDQARGMLDLPLNFTRADIDQRYRALIRQWHPDRFSNRSPEEQSEANRRTTEINIARKVLLSGGNPASEENSKKGQAIRILQSLINGNIKNQVFTAGREYVTIDLTIHYIDDDDVPLRFSGKVRPKYSPEENQKFRTKVDTAINLITDGNFRLPQQDGNHSLPLLEFCVISIPDSAIYYMRSNNISIGWEMVVRGQSDQTENKGFEHLEYGQITQKFETYITQKLVPYVFAMSNLMLDDGSSGNNKSNRGPANRQRLGGQNVIFDDFYRMTEENILKDINSVISVIQSRMEQLSFDRKPITIYDFRRFSQIAINTEKQYRIASSKRLNEDNTTTNNTNSIKVEKKSSLSYILGALSEYSAAYTLIDTAKRSTFGPDPRNRLEINDDNINAISNKLEGIKKKARYSDISEENIELGIRLGERIASHIYKQLIQLPDILFCKIMVTGTDTRHGASDDLKIELYKDPSMVTETLVESLRYSLKVTKSKHTTISGSKSPIEFLRRLTNTNNVNEARKSKNDDDSDIPDHSVKNDPESIQIVRRFYGELGDRLIRSLDALKINTKAKNLAKKNNTPRDKKNENDVSIESTKSLANCIDWWISEFYQTRSTLFNDTFRWLLGMDNGVDFIKAVYNAQGITVSDKETTPVYKALVDSLMNNMVLDIKFTRKETATEKIGVAIRMKVKPEDIDHLKNKITISDDGTVEVTSTSIELRVADSGYIKPYINTNTRNMKI